MDSLTIGSLFSGIGGLELGLERAGLGPVLWQAESNAFCRGILAKHWPEAVRYRDVREIDGRAERPEIICGGFPCQDISFARPGIQAGLAGAKSGLWREFARVVRVLRPRAVVIENVPALRMRGLCDVLRGLASCGYDAEWDCIPASACGASHLRDRLFVVAVRVRDGGVLVQAAPDPRGGVSVPTDRGVAGKAEPLHDADADADAHGREQHSWARAVQAQLAPDECGGGWPAEPGVGRVVHGVPERVDRVSALGNAVVPAVAEVIGRAIVEAINA